MPWAQRRFQREAINKAARDHLELLRNHSDVAEWGGIEWTVYDHCTAVMNNWRACHAYPMNIIQMNLRRACARVDSTAIVAQRTKRMTSIVIKLVRRPNMKLTQMQDIGGCRGVVKSIQAVYEVDRFYKTRSRAKHRIVHRDDYISEPQLSGYRGIHLVHRFYSDRGAGDHYNGLKIEMQLRSQYQHAWATAVETVGTFVGEDLKAGQGSVEWLRFFQLMGSVIALRERSPLVPNTPAKLNELRDELDNYAYRLNVENRLIGYVSTLQRMQQHAEGAHYYLLKLDPTTQQLIVTGFKAEEQDQAQAALATAESDLKMRDTPGVDAVLVSVPSLAELPKAYPNYFADTRVFVELLRQALSGHQRRIFTGALKLNPQPEK
jgi:hypothetical protein